MGNCTEKGHDEDEGKKLTPTLSKSNKIAVLTFSGPNALLVPNGDSMQPTFSDPMFFSPSNHKSLTFN